MPVKISECEINRLLNAANASDKTNLTKAGRALQKHGERTDSLFPKPKGSPQSINEQACMIVEEILRSTDNTIALRYHARFGEIIDIYTMAGRGVRYDSNNNFIGFIEKGTLT